MKKTVILAILAASLSSLCFAKPSVIMMRNNGPLRSDNGKGGVEWALEVPEGTVLELADKKVQIKDLVTSKGVTKNVSFYKVNYNGKAYYANASEVAPDGKVAVLTSDSGLYTRPRYTSFRNAALDAGTIVIVYPDQEVQDFATFSKISVMDTNRGVVIMRYVLKHKLSSSSNDVKAVRILQKAESEKDETIKNELLKAAAELNTSSQIQLLVNKALPADVVESTVSDDDISAIDNKAVKIATKDGSKLNIRSRPGRGGEVVGQVDDGTSGVISIQTNGEETIEGITSKWYFITVTLGEDEVSGWVFGGFIE